MTEREVNRARPSRRQTLLSALAAAMFAACTPGATTPTGGPTPAGATPGGATPAGSVQPATVPPVPTTAGSTPAPPTATAAVATPAPTISGTVDLEALIPDEVAGITLVKQSMTADQAFPTGEYQTAFAALLATLGMTEDGVSVAAGQGSNTDGEIVVVQAYRIAGVETATLLDALTELFLEFESETSVITPITIGGKELLVIGAPTTDAQYKSYYYGYGDIVFRLGYNGDDFDEGMAEIVSMLP